MSPASSRLLEVENLTVRFGAADPVRRLSFSIDRGETVAVVGESGSGKSLSALALMRLLPRNAQIPNGRIIFEGTDLLKLSDRDIRKVRGREIAMIFQEPMTSLNPVATIGNQIVEVLRLHEKLSKKEARIRAIELLDLVKIPDAEKRVDDFPHQLSGGQRQRVMIAIAVACKPKLLIADEPTTALDATIQAQILELLDELRRKLSMGLLLITHDLGVVSRWSDRVVVMYHGDKLEELPASDLFSPDRHPYTRGLAQASIRLEDGVHYTSRTLSEIRVVKDADGQNDYQIRLPVPRDLPPVANDDEPILQVDGLSVTYRTRNRENRALDKATLTLARGETLGIVGESGSGKSTLSKAIMRLVNTESGSIRFRGQDITGLSPNQLQPVRRDLQMIFQDPFASLNPRKSIRDILEAPLIVHGIRDAAERRQRIAETFEHVRLPLSAAERYPHEFSGGQRQRIGIARALILKPSLVICDEPVSALDVSIQAQILNLLVDLKRDLGLSYLFISHDLAVVQYISDRVIVMKDSRIIEESDHQTIWRQPRTDYTRALIAAAAGGETRSRALAS
ncbi:glutathione ABC transporter ATP-binding protein [Devosia sp. Root685]|uniref:ABC transporter ATP-binding protein n=1 Tax=Devosia sp. Root685 TaxID=1736587 RepID=UPI0006F6DA82|nr:ABC transporter ATP-binding protein [Devosia sp. Root685]KRB01263.1 glutathione ABC transporter ATP-binding protein [Devosia sp. Root685]